MDWEHIKQILETNGLKLVVGITVLIIGFIAAKLIIKIIKRGKGFQKIDPTARGFIEGLVKTVLYAAVIITSAGVMGIPLTSFVALIASAGVAVSLAVQGALGNFVGGIMLLILKPIRAGEYVKVGDHEGTVRAIGSFYTELVTADNRNISLPNSSLTNTAIVNYTREGTRRLDIEFGVAYGADITAARGALTELVSNTAGVLKAPSPTVLMSECADSAVKLILRLWCDQAEYWRLKFELTEGGKAALDSAGVEIAFPQMDVHIKS